MLNEFHRNVCAWDAASPGWNWTCCLEPPRSAQPMSTDEPVEWTWGYLAGRSVFLKQRGQL